MKIINLMEDSAGSDVCLAEHGLSFYIETACRKVLLDTGASDGFMQNAAGKGIDLRQVDTVILSHGHYDHTGGLLAFARQNPHAKIYVQKKAVGAFYSLRNGQEKYIGMKAEIASLPQIVFLEGNRTLDRELSIFTGVKGRRLWPRGNALLKIKEGERYVQDEFEHEQYLVVREGEKAVLLSGCAHNGILNILDTYRQLYGGDPTHVISGFHTVKTAYAEEDEALIRQTARELADMNTVFYSGHCTGEFPMELLRGILGDQLIPIHSGDRIL